jgi:hypothetical protein
VLQIEQSLVYIGTGENIGSARWTNQNDIHVGVDFRRNLALAIMPKLNPDPFRKPDPAWLILHRSAPLRKLYSRQMRRRSLEILGIDAVLALLVHAALVAGLAAPAPALLW